MYDIYHLLSDTVLAFKLGVKECCVTDLLSIKYLLKFLSDSWYEWKLDTFT